MFLHKIYRPIGKQEGDYHNNLKEWYESEGYNNKFYLEIRLILC